MSKLRSLFLTSTRALVVVSRNRVMLVGPRDMARLRLRERLRKEILSWEHGGRVHSSSVAELNRLMADRFPCSPRLTANGNTPATESWF
jgi:hypothetical protein